MNITELAAEYDKARQWKEQVESELKNANKRMEEASAQLADAMLEEEVSSFKTPSGTYSVSVRDYYRPDADLKEELYARLRENGLGDLVKETVNSNTLSAAMRELAEENGGEVPREYEGLVHVFSKTTISRRKA